MVLLVRSSLTLIAAMSFLCYSILVATGSVCFFFVALVAAVPILNQHSLLPCWSFFCFRHSLPPCRSLSSRIAQLDPRYSRIGLQSFVNLFCVALVTAVPILLWQLVSSTPIASLTRSVLQSAKGSRPIFFVDRSPNRSRTRRSNRRFFVNLLASVGTKPIFVHDEFFWRHSPDKF